MAYRPPNRTPVLNLGQVNESTNSPEDDSSCFPRFTSLPPELRAMVYKHYFDDLGTIPPEEQDNQPPLTRASPQLRQEALPVYYSHNTFSAGIDVWPPIYDFIVPATSLDYNTDRMLQHLSAEHLSRIRYLKLTLDFDMSPMRRFVVTLDLTQWHDYSRAVRIERTIPASKVRYHDHFRTGVDRAMRMLFDDVRPQNGERVSCRRVLESAETAVDLTFYDDGRWYGRAKKECLDVVRRRRRALRKFMRLLAEYVAFASCCLVGNMVRAAGGVS